MKVLIIGGGGYIGCVLTEELLSGDYDVTVFDSLRYGQTPFLNLVANPRFNFIKGDFRDIDPAILADHDCIIHLAAIVGAPACDSSPYDATTINLEGVKRMVSLLSNDQMLLYPCTNSGYGRGQGDLYCDETSPIEPISLYGKTKLEAESCILSRQNSISFRLATVFGASLAMRTGLLVNDFVLKALRDGVIVLFESHFKRNYIHIRDVAQAFIMGIQKFDRMCGNVYNVGLSDANLSKFELCQEIKRHIDFVILQEEFTKDRDQRNYLVSNEKIESFGFAPRHSISDGVLELIKAYEITTISYYQR